MRSSSCCCWTSSSSDGSRGYGPARWCGGSSPSFHSWTVRREQRVYECLKYSVMLQEVTVMVMLWYPFHSCTHLHLHFNAMLHMLLYNWNYSIVHSVIIYALSCWSMSLDLSFQVLISKCSLNSFTFSSWVARLFGEKCWTSNQMGPLSVPWPLHSHLPFLVTALDIQRRATGQSTRQSTGGRWYHRS